MKVRTMILEDNNKLYMNLLTGSDNQKHLDWLARLRIAEDAAKGGYYISNFLIK